MSQSSFRILSIDGGGARGYLSAAILANVEQYLNDATQESVPLGCRFDLIAGTSVGGLIALGLALGHPASELRDLLLDLVPRVFGVRHPFFSSLKACVKPKYKAEVLEAELRPLFGTATLRDLIRDVCITSVSLIDAKPRLHKTDYFSRNAGRLDESLIGVAMATAAAPTYFSARTTRHSANLVDGGLAANNPSVIALVDALQFERPSKRGIERPDLNADGDKFPLLLSIGTGQLGPLPYNCKRLVNGGKIQWATPIWEVILMSQAHLVHHQMNFLLGSRYLRIDPILNVAVKLDDAKHFRELINKADINAESEQFLTREFIE